MVRGGYAPPKNSMDVRARAATFLFGLSVTLTLRGSGFAPRHLKRYASAL